MTTQPWQEEFDSKCIVNKFGECKYWKPESFGYAKDDGECSMDEFFPEKIKSFISTLISKERADERAKTIKECGEVARRYDSLDGYDFEPLAKAIENLK